MYSYYDYNTPYSKLCCSDVISFTVLFRKKDRSLVHLSICKLGKRNMGGRSTSSIMMMSALIITWFSYLLLWMCFPSRTPTSAKAQVVTNTGQNITVDYLPSRPDGVIFISHAASGPAREAVYILSRFGYQVLVGVKDKIERRSFLYSLRKGIELIDFDVSDPSTYPPLIYRLRHIRRDLDRPIVGVLINLAGINTFQLFTNESLTLVFVNLGI